MIVILLTLSVGTLAALIKPHLLNDRKMVKKPFSRPKILAVGMLSFFVAIVGFGTVLGMTEPASVTEARAAQEAAEQKAAEEAARIEEERRKAKEPVVKTEIETEVIPFETRTEESNTIPKGESRVTVEGEEGERLIVYAVTYVEGKEVFRVVKEESVTKEPVTKVITQGTYVAPRQQAAQPSNSGLPPQGSSCHPSYTGCVPNVSYDLDCKDIRRRVQVIGPDVYRLDGDNDGWGCESW